MTKSKPAKTNEAAINNSLTLAAKVIDDQFAVQQKIFGYLNDFASGKHLAMHQRVDTEALLAQVYGDLAAHFGELKAVAAGNR